MRFVYSSFWPWSRAFVGINNTSVFGLAFLNTAASFPAAIYWCFAWHCYWHRNFQLSTRGFHCELEFFIVWFNEEYSSQLSGIVELWFLDCPSSFYFFFRCIRHMLPHILPYIVWTRGRLFPRKSPHSWTMCTRQVAFRSIKFFVSIHVPIIFNIFLQQYVE